MAKKKKVATKRSGRPAKKKVVKKSSKKKVVKKSLTKKKETERKTAKKATRGRKAVTLGMPKFDSSKHIKLNDLAKKCGITYQSLYIRQKRTDIWAIEINLKGRCVIAFTKADAKKIQKDSAKPELKSAVRIDSLENELKLSRPKIQNILIKLRIFSEKRRSGGDQNRSVLTVTSSQATKIRKFVKA